MSNYLVCLFEHDSLLRREHNTKQTQKDRHVRKTNKTIKQTQLQTNKVQTN